ncbi:MAG: glycosyltransferase [Bacteroidetes bacterium]|nr:glycosyltransferase [Bacteroidota bacterium]
MVIVYISIFLLVYSYLIFPWTLQVLTKNKSSKNIEPSSIAIKKVSVVLAVYNEEKVIREKIESFLSLNYPAGNIEFIIGSDGSTDTTEIIIEEYINQYPRMRLVKFGGRTGKSGILNQLIPLAIGEILILTDANIYFEKEMVMNLVNGFDDASIGLVAANIQNTGMDKIGISLQEEKYIQRENLIKYREGELWGTLMGAFGACYAVRKKLVKAIPPNHLMEDFYISMKVLEAGYKNIMSLKAIAFEDVSESVAEEFKRKVRISAGNFQNLTHFYKMLWPVYKPIGFCFLSHKVLRWLGPFWIIFIIGGSAILYSQNLFFMMLFWFSMASIFSPLIDWILAKLNIHNFVVRLISYFFLMNFALLIGLGKYFKGIKTSAWQPTQRNIKD